MKLLLIGLLTSTICFGQNLAGIWEGTLTQNSQTFKFEIAFKSRIKIKNIWTIITLIVTMNFFLLLLFIYR